MVSKNEVKRLIKIANLIKISKNDSINIDLFEIPKNKKYYNGIKFTFLLKGLEVRLLVEEDINLKYENNSEKL